MEKTSREPVATLMEENTSALEWKQDWCNAGGKRDGVIRAMLQLSGAMKVKIMYSCNFYHIMGVSTY